MASTCYHRHRRLSCAKITRMTARETTEGAGELLIARHGQAHCNLTGVIAGPATCTGLTPLGRAQAQALAVRLQHEARDSPVTEIHASPRRRAQETAEIIAHALALHVQYHDDLRDPDYGPAAEGRTWTDLLAAFSGDPTACPELPLAHGGEPWTASATRVMQALTRLRAGDPSGRILVVGHAETVKAAYHLFLGIPASQPLPIKLMVANASLTTWRPTGATYANGVGRWTLVTHNDISHLATATATATARS